MNKLTLSVLLVSLFAVVALARTSPQIRRPFKFTPGQTYIYEYRASQWNGLANLADQYSGLILDCDVILQALPGQSGQEVLMRLDDVKVEQLHTQTLYNGDIRKLNPGQEQSPRQVTMFKEELGKPIKFTYVDGKILSFVAQSDDSEWSINIKKSILSLFQLDLAPTKIIKSTTNQIKEQLMGYTSEDVISETSEMPLVYPIYEESFGGICETLYQIDSVDHVEEHQRQSYVEFNDVLNVTKTVNYKNCLTDPSISYDRHSFDVNTQTIKGKLFSKQATTTNQNYHSVPEELRSKYSNVYTSQDYGDNVASPAPVERYSFTKYNISTAPQWLVNNPQVPVRNQADMSLIEGIYSEGKIKYQTTSDTLVSETQQSLRLITCAPSGDIARVAPETSASAVVEPRQPHVQYETIQCELSAQKLKFYQAYTKLSQAQQYVIQQQQNSIGHNSQTSELYSHRLILPFALSASWYPIVASGQGSLEQPIERLLDPEQLSKSYENLLISLAEDVLAEDVAQSKRAGEKIVRLINVVAFMPKYKLAQVYEHITKAILQAKQRQYSARGAQPIVNTNELSKWKVVRKLYLDSLPLAGSKQAIEMIEFLIESNRVQNWEAKELCESVPANLRYPDTEIIKAFIRITQLPHVLRSRSLLASCSIAAGKMIGNAYSKSQDASYRPTIYDVENLPSNLRTDDLVKQVVKEADPRPQTSAGWNSDDQAELYQRLVLDDQDLIQFIQIFKNLLAQTPKYHEKVIYIETLAHMKTPHVLPILEPYVTGRISLSQCLSNEPLDIGRPVEQSQWYNYYARQQSQSNKDWTSQNSYGAEECNYMRTIVIYALAHLSHVSPNKVQAMLLPVFENTYEPYQIRIAAFTSLILNPVPEHILERIASQMWREPSKEVASFVVGTIDTISKMTTPRLAPFKFAALKAAESMPKQYLDTWKFSWFAGGDHFDHLKQTGLNWVAELVKSNVSSIPRGGYLRIGRFHGTSGSQYDNHFEIGFTSKGLETLLKEYITYNQQTDTETSILASIFENLYYAKDDVVNFYNEARDSIVKSIVRDGVNSETRDEPLSRNFAFLMRKQPIQGVNSKSDTTRPKRSVTFKTRSSTDDDEEPKLTIFSKLFDSTSYHALDKKQIIDLIRSGDEYIKMAVDELILGGKLHYVKMMSPGNMWHMVPSAVGLPVIVTHRTPVIASLVIEGTNNGQLTSNKISQHFKQQVTSSQVPNVQGFNYASPSSLNVTVMVRPKIMVSKFNFMFAVEQANGDAYGAQVEKSCQISLPMEVSVAYSVPKQTVSLTIEPKTPARISWTKEAAKTFIGPLALANAHPDNWLGQEQLIRTSAKLGEHMHRNNNELYSSSILSAIQTIVNKPKQSHIEAIKDLETPQKLVHRFVQPLINMEICLDGVTDDEEIVTDLVEQELTRKQSISDESDPDYDQHSKSGPFHELLHVLDTANSRPTKYLEFYSTLQPIQSNKSPVYRFDVILDTKQKSYTAATGFNTIIGSQQRSSGRLSPETFGDYSQYKNVYQQSPIMIEA